MEKQLSNCQAKASIAFADWFFDAKAGDRFFLSGAAGTGKTWLINHLMKTMNLNPVIMAPTNKACRVLKSKGIHAVTIHSALYYPPHVYQNKDGSIVLDFEYEGMKTGANLIVIDEVSMIGNKVGDDIDRMLSECLLPILLVGDVHQLPPVADTQWVGKPDYEMTELLRQDMYIAPNIIKLATSIRENKLDDLDLCNYPDLSIQRKYTIEDVLEADIILTRTHASRRAITKRKRENREYSNYMYINFGEPLMILRNDYKRSFYNGQELIFDHMNEDYIVCRELPHNYVRYIPVKKYVFEDLFDPSSYRNSNYTFGYATTVHKAQGSEWDTVLLLDVDNRHPTETKEEYRRWLYTAVTRAKKRLIIA